MEKKKGLPASATPKALQAGISTLVGVIIIVVAIIILFGGVFAYQYFVEKSQIPMTNVQPNPKSQNSNTETAGPAPSNIEGWKTYKNIIYGYELMYPNSWSTLVDSHADVFISPNLSDMLECIKGGCAPGFAHLEIKVTSVSPDISFTQAVKNEFYSSRDKSISFEQENEKIGGIDGLKLTTTCDGPGCGFPQWFVLKNSRLYSFTSALWGLDQNSEKNIDKIISTFKFTQVK